MQVWRWRSVQIPTPNSAVWYRPPFESWPTSSSSNQPGPFFPMHLHLVAVAHDVKDRVVWDSLIRNWASPFLTSGPSQADGDSVLDFRRSRFVADASTNVRFWEMVVGSLSTCCWERSCRYTFQTVQDKSSNLPESFADLFHLLIAHLLLGRAHQSVFIFGVKDAGGKADVVSLYNIISMFAMIRYSQAFSVHSHGRIFRSLTALKLDDILSQSGINECRS